MSMTPADLARQGRSQLGFIMSAYEESYPPSLWGVVPDPRLGTLIPDTGSAGAGAILVRVLGSKFLPTSVVEIDLDSGGPLPGLPQPTTFVSSTELTVSFDPAAPGVSRWTVRTPAVGGPAQESNGADFTATALGGDPEPPPDPDPEPTGGDTPPEDPYVGEDTAPTPAPGATGKRARKPRAT